MNLDEFCQHIKDRFPSISSSADKEYTRLWDDFTDTEYYSYSWFEALANALNAEMRKDVEPEKYAELFETIGQAFVSEGPDVQKAIDVAFVENLFWQVPERKAAPYWLELPKTLKELYLDFHGKSPL